MIALKGILVFLHIVVAAAWLAYSVRLQVLVRLAGVPGVRAQGDVAVRVMNGLAVALPLLGVGAMLADGRGFAGYGPEYHTSITLALLLLAVQFFGIARVWKGLADGARPARMSMWMGIAHLTWAVILVLMLWPQYLGPVFGG